MTCLSSNMVTDKVLDIVGEGFGKTKGELYFLSLEALKNACIEEYEAVLGYDLNARRILLSDLRS